LAIVTLIALVPLGFPGFAGLELPLEWPHAATDNTAAATKAGAVNRNSRDRHRARTGRFTIDGSPLLFGSGVATAS
jgi:hypothetical protein